LELLFAEDFGCPPSRLFRRFDPEPVAAASLAQVFKAETNEGERVAVKAQYIDLRDRYDGDIWTVKVLLKMVAYIHPKFSLSWIFEVIQFTKSDTFPHATS
jgi:aarF domain-containing kinase